MLGHSSTQIVPRYAQVVDQDRLDAVKKLEVLRQSEIRNQAAEETNHKEVRPTAEETRQ
jgi:hypothetical protein